MQLSVSTPTSDTTLAALLLGGETVPAASAAPGAALPPAAFEQLMTGLTPAATPSATAAPVATEAPVALLVAPALRNFSTTTARASDAPPPAEPEIPLPVPGEVTVPTVATAKAAPRPAPRTPARSSSAKSESPAANAPTVTPEQLPLVTPLAPQPLPTDLLTSAPAIVAADDSSPADPTFTPSGEAVAPSAPQVAAPAIGRGNILARGSAPLASRRDSTAVAVTPLASSAPLAVAAPLAAPETSAPASEILTTPKRTPTSSPVAAQSPQSPASAPLFSTAPTAGVPASDPSVVPAQSAAPDAPTPAPLRTFAPADLVSRQFTPSPRATAPAAPETVAASFADSRSPDRLQRIAEPTLSSDFAPAAPLPLAFNSNPPSANLAGDFTSPTAPVAFPVAVSPRPPSFELAPDKTAIAAADTVALAAPTVAPSALPTGVIAPSAVPAASTPAATPASAEALAAALTASNPLPAANASNLPTAPRAKIAARSEIRGIDEKVTFSASDKNFLSDGGKHVANTSERVGTDVAKSGPVMSTTTLTDQPAPAAVPAHASFAPVARVEATDFSAIEATVAPGESASVADAHRAVEAVLVAADRTANGDRHTVNLHFTVAGNELAVRVEMRADEVRATFHTASPELRDALAREWQAVSADPSTDSSLRLAPAVFTSGQGNTNGGSSSLGGDASSRQRDPGAQRGEDQTSSTFATRSLRTPDSAPASSVLTPAAASATARGGAHRLLAHA